MKSSTAEESKTHTDEIEEATERISDLRWYQGHIKALMNQVPKGLGRDLVSEAEEAEHNLDKATASAAHAVIAAVLADELVASSVKDAVAGWFTEVRSQPVVSAEVMGQLRQALIDQYGSDAVDALGAVCSGLSLSLRIKAALDTHTRVPELLEALRDLGVDASGLNDELGAGVVAEGLILRRVCIGKSCGAVDSGWRYHKVGTYPSTALWEGSHYIISEHIAKRITEPGLARVAKLQAVNSKTWTEETLSEAVFLSLITSATLTPNRVEMVHHGITVEVHPEGFIAEDKVVFWWDEATSEWHCQVGHYLLTETCLVARTIARAHLGVMLISGDDLDAISAAGRKDSNGDDGFAKHMAKVFTEADKDGVRTSTATTPATTAPSPTPNTADLDGDEAHDNACDTDGDSDDDTPPEALRAALSHARLDKVQMALLALGLPASVGAGCVRVGAVYLRRMDGVWAIQDHLRIIVAKGAEEAVSYLTSMLREVR